MHSHRLLLLQRRGAGQKKTPLLRSMEAINAQALRILRLFGNEDGTASPPPSAPEQEYFLVDQDMYNERRSALYRPHALGAKPPKGRSWRTTTLAPSAARGRIHEGSGRGAVKLGILAKTKHNEVAPHSTNWRPSSAPPTSPPTTTS